MMLFNDWEQLLLQQTNKQCEKEEKEVSFT
jgi:hypothetical protein